MAGGFKGIVSAFKAAATLFRGRRITYNFPPEAPITEKARGRHIYYSNLCRGCGLCAKICPNKAIEMVKREKDGKTILRPQIDYAKCCFCGLCVNICPTGALQFTSFPMLVAMDKKSLLYPPERLAEPPKIAMPPKTPIKGLKHWARSRSFWVLNYFTGCCFIEAVPWVGSGYDMERFGMLVANTPRHADVLIIGGYVTVKTLRRIIRIYQQMPNPKFVIALGNCPMTGGTYWDCYNTIKHLDDYIPVDIWIAGCPPRPEPIGLAVVEAMHAVQSGYAGKREEVHMSREFELPPLKEGKLGEREFILPFGPQHPASGNFHIAIKVEGEHVTDARVDVGYLHRGFEKLMEHRTWYQNIMLAPRICVLDGSNYELAYAGVVEKLAGIEAPRRAKYLRAIQAELSRIQSHLLNLGLIGYAAGLDTLKRIAWGDRERILLLLEKLTGARIYCIYNLPGGVRRDITPSFRESAKQTIKYMRKRLKIYDDLVFRNSTFIARTEKIGVIPRDMALEYSIVGPNLRSSGVAFDVRKATPYEAYGELEFKVPKFMEGDAYHRSLCRRMEIEESLNLVEQALDKLPGGKVREMTMGNGRKFAPITPIPANECLHCVESARGELCFHAVSDGSAKPYRVKIRGPTFDYILVLLPDLLKGAKIADTPVIYWSLDNCPADHDR